MDPFRIDGPALINVSGGRTSALMLRRVLDAHGGTLPADAHAVFQNTGKERHETLDFVRDVEAHWGVPIHWIEYAGRDLRAPIARAVIDGVTRLPHMEVTHATASRNGEPFARLIAEKRYLPNGVTRFCTQEMKITAGRDFMRALGYTEWESLIGLRFDEARRVANIRASEHPAQWEPRMPLYDARITKADVTAFWAASPFDLRLQWWESNCDGCYLKSADILERIERDHPGTLAWWHAREVERGATFQSHRSFASIISRARLPTLTGVLNDPDDAGTIPCTCTE